MSTDLVTIDQSPQHFDTGLDSVAPLRPSIIQFIQPSTNDTHGGEPGQFYDEATGDLLDKLVVVPLKVMENRVMYPPGAEIRRGVKPLCRSDDGIVPSRYIETPQARNCASCKYQEWVNDRPGPCKSSLKLLVLLKETEAPRYVVASGTSVSPLRTYLRRINEDVKKHASRGERVNLYDYYFTIGSERKRNYYMMTFSGLTRVKELGEFSASFASFVKASRSAEDTQSDAVDAEILDI